MSFRAAGRILWTVIVFSPFSCTNPPPPDDFSGYGPGPSDDGGSVDGATGTNHPQPTPTGSQNTPGPANSGDAAGSQPTSHDSGSANADAGRSQDASTSGFDASALDASVADVTVVDSPLPTVADGCTQNLGCMLSPPPSTGDIRQDCVNRINQFRTQCACLPALQRWTDGEMCADQEAQYDSQQMSAHAGFIATESACGQGSSMWAACCSTGAFARPLANAQDECPGYPDDNTVVSTCLQQMWNEGPPPNGESVQACEMDNAGCYQMHGHFINMTNTMDTKVACGFYTTPSGQVWAAQNFAP